MTEITVIDKPGFYDLPEDVYHADRLVPGGSLSVSGAKKLLAPSCPAIYQYEREHPHRPTKAMELGTVVHGMILGTGQPVAVIDADSYRTKAAQNERDEAEALGMVPMLRKDYDEAQRIAQAVRDHDVTGALYAEGDAEGSVFWQDPEFGIWLRMRFDWLTYIDGQPVCPDLKTAADSSPPEFARSVDKYRYYMQHAHYCDGLAAVLGCDPDDIDFLFAVVPVTEPYLVMTYRLDDEAVQLGREQNRIAREIFRDCSESGVWPSWSADISPLSLPHWAANRIRRETDEYYD
jgi:hypothetical protein